ncbi:MAG TPA: DUF4159 domain-containing protein [Candidatus Limnocylindrales bacterium]|nr:DUF4159 domain-containing protein [Candidatus Limnocylindrales bacterium]
MRGFFVAGGILCAVTACALFAQKPFRQYPGWEHTADDGSIALPADYKVPGEWTFARLMYPTTRLHIDWQSEQARGWDWHQGFTNWTIDYPKSDRHLAMAIRRLTRIDARSSEQPVNVEEDDDIFNYPWLYAVEVGHWELTDKQIKKLREFFDRGGFFMCDDFHGSDEWDVFVASFHKIFPERHIVDIDSKDPIFHTVYDLDDRYQVPGMQYTQTGRVYEKDGIGGEFRAVYDDHGRIVAAICHNMDLGDSWENADQPIYPQKFSALGLRIGVNYVVYAMTH